MSNRAVRLFAPVGLILLAGSFPAGRAGAQLFGADGLAERVEALEAHVKFRDSELRPLLTELVAKVERLESETKRIKSEVERLRHENALLRKVYTTPSEPQQIGQDISSKPSGTRDAAGAFGGAGGAFGGGRGGATPSSPAGLAAIARTPTASSPPGATGGLGVTGATGGDGGFPDGPIPAPPTPRETFDAAMTLLRQGVFDDAEAALVGFSSDYPEELLAGEALYWIGEARLIKGNAKAAADAFLAAFTSYPDSPKAPDALFKFATTLLKLRRKREACQSLRDLGTRFPNASGVLLKRAETEARRARCGG